MTPGQRLVVEADGGSRGNPGPAGYGAALFDDEGKLVAECAEAIGEATNNVAEYRGLIAGLTAAHAYNPSAAVVVRMDSKLVVEQMSGRWKIKHPDMQALAREARTLASGMTVAFEWVPRHQNGTADALANAAMDAARKGETWNDGQVIRWHRTPEATSPACAASSAEPVSDATLF